MRAIAAAAFTAFAAVLETSAAVPHAKVIVQIVADDLGYNDLGCMNGNKTLTPHIDGLFREGVFLSSKVGKHRSTQHSQQVSIVLFERVCTAGLVANNSDRFYTFRVCAPSRAASMTGRYPWGIGFYDMSDDGHHCVDPSFKMLPAYLRDAGYRTHAAGKWDVGYVEQHCTPTFRGFESFIGYYTACTSDYWYHGAPGGNATMDPCGGVDFHNSTTAVVRGANMRGPGSVNGTYDQEVFTQRAVDIIRAHNKSEDLYLYVAYHNVHDACQHDRFALGLNAPKETVDLYGTTRLDTWKVQAAMTTELDYGVGNITAALKETGLWDDTFLALWADNGGPLDHSSNWPLRAGKGSEYEGGYRTWAMASGPALPEAVRGSTYDGMMHSSDWLPTLVGVDAVSGAPLDVPASSRDLDGHNMWPAIAGLNLTSPRTEVIHAVTNQYFNASLGNVGVQAARFGDWKVIVGLNCDSQRVWQAWPAPAGQVVDFGLTGGQLEAGTDHARAPLLDGTTSSLQPAAPDAASVCLFNLRSDHNETTNVAADPENKQLLESLLARLKAAADTGPPLSIAFADVGPKNKTTDALICQQEHDTGYLEPVDWERPASSAFVV